MKKINKNKISVSVLSIALSSSILANSTYSVSANENYKKTTENFLENKNEILKTSFRSTNFNVRAVLPLDENENLLISTKEKSPSKLKIIYDDETTEIKDAGDGYNYTPKGSNIQSKVDAVKSDFESIVYEDFYDILNPRVSFVEKNKIRNELREKNKVEPTETELNQEVKKYYLDALDMKSSFERVKQNLDTILYGIFEHSQYAEVDYVKGNKEKIIVALTLLERQYNFKFGNVYAKDLITYYPEFFGFVSYPLENLINIGTITYEGAKLSSNIRTFTSKIYPITNQKDIISFIEYSLSKFENTDLDTWFKNQSKAIIVETETSVGNSNLIEKMKKSDIAKNHLIGLLNLTDDYIYVISTMKTINYGLVDTYIDRENQTDRTQLTEKIKNIANHQQKFLDFWYRITEKKEDLLNHKEIFVIDTMRKFGADTESTKKLWSKKYGEGAVGGVREFLTPLNLYTEFSFADGQASGENLIVLYLPKGLEDRGHSVYSHELTHILDKEIWFNGYGRRINKGAEVYARGLFESLNNTNSGYEPIFNLNTSYTLGENRTQNKNPERFQNDSDLKEYANGLLDVIYTLDYAEAKVSLEKSQSEKMILFNKVELVLDSSKQNVMNDKFSNITETEANNLTDIYSLVDNNIVSGRLAFKGNETVGVARDNDYFVVPLFEPIYAGLQNDLGSTGDITFRRNSYEILGEYGYTNGMVPYLSGKHSNDKDALNEILDSKYNGSLLEFKKDMFKRRIEKVSKLKATSKFTNFEELENLMKEAVEKDLAIMKQNKEFGTPITTNVNNVRNLKFEIYKEYLNSTDDFRESIYEEKVQKHNVTINFKYENEIVGTENLEIENGQNIENIENYIPIITDGEYKISDSFDKNILNNITEDKTIEIELVKVINGINILNFDKDKIEKIEILNPPTKTVYKENEILDLTGLKVKITDENEISKVVDLENFKNYEILTNKQNGEVLTVTDEKVVLIVNGKTVEFNIKVNPLSKSEKFEPVVDNSSAIYKTDETEENILNKIFEKITVDENVGEIKKEIVGDVPKTIGEYDVKVKVIYDDKTFDEVTVKVNVIDRDKKNFNVVVKYLFEKNSIFEKTFTVVENENVENIENYIPTITDGEYKISNSFDKNILNNITEDKTIEIELVKVINGINILNFDKDKIEKIEILNPPTKTVYKENETLDLTGLKVKITDENEISKVVDLENFKNYEILTNKQNGDILIVTDTEILISLGYKTLKINITVSKNETQTKEENTNTDEKTDDTNTNSNENLENQNENELNNKDEKEKEKNSNQFDKKDDKKINKNEVPKTAISNNIFVYFFMTLISLVLVKILSKKNNKM